jgi:hypothetical protein
MSHDATAAAVTLALGLLLAAPFLAWAFLGGQRDHHRAWERLIAKREAWVAQGCPLTRIDPETGALVGCGNPFWLTVGGAGRLEDYPDLLARNRAAHARYRELTRGGA